METIRSFIAVELPSDMKQSISSLQQNANFSKGVRCVHPDNIHITIKFLGQINADQVRKVCTVFDNIGVGFKKFRVHVAGVGAFPGANNPKVIWTGFKDSGELPSIYNFFENRLAETGFANEKRPFSPHLTIARVRDPKMKKQVKDFLDEQSRADLGSFEMEKITFFKSELTPSGAQYWVIKTVKLTGGSHQV